MVNRVDVRAIRRRQILDVAEQLAARRGWTETTIADICQHLGVSTRVLTYHFANKDELVIAALEDVLARFREHFEPIFDTDAPFAEEFGRHLLRVHDLTHADPDLPLLLLHSVAFSVPRPEMAARIQALFHESRLRGTHKLAMVAEREGIALDDPLATMHTLFTVSLGLLLGPLLAGEGQVPAVVATEAARMVRQYLALLAEREPVALAGSTVGKAE